MDTGAGAVESVDRASPRQPVWRACDTPVVGCANAVFYIAAVHGVRNADMAGVRAFDSLGEAGCGGLLPLPPQRGVSALPARHSVYRRVDPRWGGDVQVYRLAAQRDRAM